jgi:hypothetical protein
VKKETKMLHAEFAKLVRCLGVIVDATDRAVEREDWDRVDVLEKRYEAVDEKLITWGVIHFPD